MQTITKAISGLLCVILLAGACSKENPYDNPFGNSGRKDSTLVYTFSSPEYVFGFVGQKRYSYCPSVLEQEDGLRHIFFCGNPNQGIMVDNVYHFTENLSGAKTDPISVLQPSLSWDSHHTCDPCVIQGEFKMDGTMYKYAMFYLSNPMEYYYNEVGVAFSNDLNAATWVKYPKQIVEKTWTQEGDQDLGGQNRSWGVGQPTAVSLDKKGKVLIAYTCGDASGSREAYSILDLSDMDTFSPQRGIDIVRTGCKTPSGSEDWLNNCDIAINQEENKIVMVRNLHTDVSTYPAFIEEAVEIDWMNLDDFLSGKGEWKVIGAIDQTVSGFPRNHNACLMRDNYGHLKDWDTPTVYFTVSKAAPDVTGANGNHAEWTYHIYRTDISKKYRYFNKK